jgi:hypothetical protein
VARMGDRKGAYRVLMGRAGGKRPLGRPKRRRENINRIFKKWGASFGNHEVATHVLVQKYLHLPTALAAAPSYSTSSCTFLQH